MHGEERAPQNFTDYSSERVLASAPFYRELVATLRYASMRRASVSSSAFDLSSVS